MHPSLLSNLDLHLQGKYRLGASAERDLHQGLWNGSADSNTVVLVKCSSSDDVQAAIRIAGEADLKLSVLSGGHDWVGRAVSHGGMTLDLRAMHSAVRGGELNILKVEGGAVVKWADEEERGADYVERLETLPNVKVVKKEWVEYKQIFDESGDSAWPAGRGYKMDSHNIPRLGAEAIDAIVELAYSVPSPRTCIMLHDFHGGAAEVGAQATAFPLRRNHFNMQVVASWDPEDSEAAQQGSAWIVKARQQMEPLSFYGGYPAVLGLECAQRARLFYHDHMDRLKVIKNTYDPGNMFAADFGIFRDFNAVANIVTVRRARLSLRQDKLSSIERLIVFVWPRPVSLTAQH